MLVKDRLQPRFSRSSGSRFICRKRSYERRWTSIRFGIGSVLPIREKFSPLDGRVVGCLAIVAVLSLEVRGLRSALKAAMADRPPAMRQRRPRTAPSRLTTWFGAESRGQTYLSSTCAPASSNFFLISSASSFDTASLIVAGADSTRSLASLRPRLGDLADRLDDVDLLVADRRQHDVELGLLLGRFAPRRRRRQLPPSAPRPPPPKRRSALRGLDEVVELEHGHLVDLLDEVFGRNCHSFSPSSFGRMLAEPWFVFSCPDSRRLSRRAFVSFSCLTNLIQDHDELRGWQLVERPNKPR